MREAAVVDVTISAVVVWVRAVLLPAVRHPVTSQLVGAAVAVVGLALLVGVAWTLLIAGVGLLAVGTLREVDGVSGLLGRAAAGRP